jgi:hypothetical protein
MYPRITSAPAVALSLVYPAPTKPGSGSHLAERQAQEREKQAAAHNREMEAALRQYGHAK